MTSRHRFFLSRTLRLSIPVSLVALFISGGSLAAPPSGAADTIDVYTAAWNEPDGKVRRELLEKAWAETGVYVDPTARIEGREALLEHIAGFQQQMPEARLELTSGVDVHHESLLRFRWRLFGADGTTLTEGMDYGELDGDGRLIKIVGFFGPFPSVAP